MERTNRFVLIALLTMLSLITAAAQSDKQTLCPEVKIEAERLSDLNIPRAGHEQFCVNGEYVVAGGHTNGFVPTPTAEYYKDGEWHLLQMVYSHDFGTSVILKSGKVLLAGGCEQNIGVGQTHTAEMYDPVSHTFNGFGSMSQKRTLASALELDSGKVVISGNWYHDDGIEIYDGKRNFYDVKDVAVPHVNPIIFRTSKDDVLIIGSQDTRGETTYSAVADCLIGDTLHIPFLETWHPLLIPRHRDAESFIGDEAAGYYAYLLPVQDSIGQVAIAQVENGSFSLLPTVCPVPMRSQWEEIEYATTVIVDRQAGRGYIMGIGCNYKKGSEQPYRFYVLCIDYAQVTKGDSASLTLYYTDPLSITTDVVPCLTSDGNILMAGGLLNHSNFTPSNTVYLLHVSQRPVAAKGNNNLWLIAMLILTALAVITIHILYRKKFRHSPLESGRVENIATETETVVIDPEADKALMERICKLMEEQRLYQNSDLKVTDIATALGSNRRFISDCINSQQGCSFTQFVNTYRIDHAKRLLRQEPNKKIADVYLEAGFSNEQSFFRTFKAITGMTPSEWKAQ